MRAEQAFPRLEVEIPWLTTEQMIEVDRAMIEDFNIELIQMMENAGRSLALVAKTRFLNGSPNGRRVAVLAGTGGNGGGAMVAARRLAGWGASVKVFSTASDDRMTPVPRHQMAILRRMGVSVQDACDLTGEPELILDGVIGYSLNGRPHGAAAAMIAWANAQVAPVLALDAPSGVDTTSGQVFEPAIHADATVTLALPKVGLQQPKVAPYVGELYLADISVPPQLYASPGLGLKVPPIFGAADILRLA